MIPSDFEGSRIPAAHENSHRSRTKNWPSPGEPDHSVVLSDLRNTNTCGRVRRAPAAHRRTVNS